jgi:oligosaccharyltransferase complex subunit gamma
VIDDLGDNSNSVDSTDKADPIHAWLSRQLPDAPHPPLVRPINYMKIAVSVTTVLGLITFFSVASPYILPVIQNRNLWAAISLIAILLFTSGHMFNHIRKVPYVSGDGKGGISYFAGGFQNQYGLETQIVAAMCKSCFLLSGLILELTTTADGILAFATISLALKVPRMTDPRAQQIAVFIWGGVILGMYSFLLSVFRIKNGGYPFFLPPF